MQISNRKALVVGFILVFLLLLPYILLGENAIITIHDFLDSNPVHANTIISLGLIGNPDGILPVLDGVPSMNYISLIPVDIKTILYLIFPMYWAIVINLFFVKFMAFLGMYLLCKHYILRGNELYSIVAAVLFCMIPFYADYGLSSAGVPLFLYSVLNIENKKKLYLSYVLIVFFACNSSLNLVGLFICVFWGIWIVYKLIKKEKVYRRHILGLILMCIVYMFVNISIIYNYFFATDIISHRLEFAHTTNIVDDILAVIQFYYYSQYHAGTFPAVVLLVTSISIYVLYGNKEKSFWYLCAVCLSIMFFMMAGTLVKHLPISLFASFQFDRFYFLYPTICFILFARSLSYLKGKEIIAMMVSLILMLSTIRNDSEAIQNVKSIINYGKIEQPSYKQFFDNSLFSKIKSDLGVNDNYATKVVCLGMHPTIAEFNKFYTLDSYVFSYSLDYKHLFRGIIKKELQKDDVLRAYFDDWGSRCYLFSSELDEIGNRYLCRKEDDISVKKLEIDTKVLKELGCEYVISAVDIKNYKELRLDLVNSYSSDESYWNIRVYRLI